jgi:DNA-binding CsgD family transcriptional regulator
MTGLFALIGFSSAMTLFGSAVAENTGHGVSVYYLSYAVCGVILVILWKGFRVLPLKSASVMVSVGAFGFVLAIASLYIPALSLPACALLGAGGAVGCMSSYFGVVMAKRYPSRFITPVIIGLGFLIAVLQTVFLESLRENLTVLYMVYLVAAVGMVILYLFLEPYLLYSFRGKPLVSIERAAELNAAAEEAEKNGEISAETMSAQTAAFVLEEAECHKDDDLTDRERQVAQEFLNGLTPKEIAAKLRIAVSTVMTHKKRIYAKKDIHNPTEFVLKLGRLQAESGAEERIARVETINAELDKR